MRYKSIELLNYAGIYNGMDLTQIKIDFTKCVSNKIIIRGMNGSGKSTLMGAIHPNPDSNDKFIPGVQARKTLLLSDGNNDYLIRYVHPVNNNGDRLVTKAYISKTIDGQMVELNPNGNVKSCKEIIYDEFGFDSAFIALSQLSSENRGLVDKKPADRKKLISSITNSMETFNAIYKSMSKKSSTLKNLINSITSKIDMLGDEPKLSVALNNITNKISILETDKENTIEAIAAVKLKIADIKSILDENNYDDIKQEISTLQKLVSSYLFEINSTIEKYNIDSPDKLKDFLDYIKMNIINIETEISILKNKVLDLLQQRESEYKSLQSKQEKLKSINGDINYQELKTLLDSSKNKLDEYESVFNLMGLMNIDLITKDEFDAAMDTLHMLLHNANVLTSSYDMSSIARDVNNRSLVNKMISEINKNRLSLEELKNRKSKLESEFVMVQSKREIAHELINRPSNCTIDSCTYISAALKAEREYPEELLVSLSNELESINNSIAELEAIIADSEQASEIRSIISSIERDLNSKFINKLPLRPDFKETFMLRVIELDPFRDIDDLYKFVDCGNMIEEYKMVKKQYSIYQSEYKLYESKNSIIESIISDIEYLQESTDKLALDIENINKDIMEKEVSLDEYKSTKDVIESVLSKYTTLYLPNKSKYDELMHIKDTMNNNVSELENLNNQLAQLNNNLIGINNDINNLTNQQQSIQHTLIMIAEYKRDLESYNNDYTLINKIRYYASPNTGIQSIFIGIFMNKILSNANELLSMLFGGEFVLQPFIVNENEFRIPAIGSGLQHDDVSSMSTAQKSAISLIISFSLLNQSSTKYNIICLDEMDGGMDRVNRSNFILLLDRVMSILGCEQAFIISHNNELDTSMCDIIALKNYSTEVINGNIIWEY